MAKQKYIAMVKMVSQDGTQEWHPGAMIELDEVQAAIHLSKGNVEPMKGTEPPAAPAPTVTVHTGPEGAPASELTPEQASELRELERAATLNKSVVKADKDKGK